MLKSMTGYANNSATMDNLLINVEIKSVNSNFLDVKLHLGKKEYLSWEHKINKLFKEEFMRGHFDLKFSVEDQNSVTELSKELLTVAKKQFEILKALKKSVDLEDPITFANLLSVINFNNDSKPLEVIDDEWNKFAPVLKGAIVKLQKSRNEEGHLLETDLTQRITKISELLQDIENINLPLINVLRERLREKTKSLINEFKLDKDRFEQEVMFYAIKADISEEITRAKGHIANFFNVMKEQTNQGKKLGFIVQELQREFNTLGSKVISEKISANVIEAKVEIEKIKEQLSNVE